MFEMTAVRMKQPTVAQGLSQEEVRASDSGLDIRVSLNFAASRATGLSHSAVQSCCGPIHTGLLCFKPIHTLLHLTLPQRHPSPRSWKGRLFLFPKDARGSLSEQSPCLTVMGQSIRA